jgi:hypothetical protein
MSRENVAGYRSAVDALNQRDLDGFLFAAFPDFTVDVIDVQASDDVTIAEIRNRATGADSRAPVIETLWQVARWRDSKVVWWSAYPIHADALKAAGLSE